MFNPLVPTDPAGQTYHGDHAYAFYQIPENAHELPIVMWHGAGQFSRTWETTPDGREGFQNIFLRRGFGTYVLDQPRRGNAGRAMIGTTIAVLILWIGAKQVNSGSMNPGILITFMILVMRLLPPLKQLSQAPTAAQQSFAAAERLFDVLDRPLEAEGGGKRIQAFSRSIDFEHVSFAYEHEPVLQDITFTARPISLFVKHMSFRKGFTIVPAALSPNL